MYALAMVGGDPGEESLSSNTTTTESDEIDPETVKPANEESGTKDAPDNKKDGFEDDDDDDDDGWDDFWDGGVRARRRSEEPGKIFCSTFFLHNLVKSQKNVK